MLYAIFNNTGNWTTDMLGLIKVVDVKEGESVHAVLEAVVTEGWIACQAELENDPVPVIKLYSTPVGIAEMLDDLSMDLVTTIDPSHAALADDTQMCVVAIAVPVTVE